MTVIQWDLFWYDDQRDFEEKLLHQEGQLLIQLEHGIYFEGENLSFHIKADKAIWHEKEIKVTLAGEKISTEKTESGNCIDYRIKMDSVSQGEKEFFIKGEEYSTSAVILVLPGRCPWAMGDALSIIMPEWCSSRFIMSSACRGLKKCSSAFSVIPFR